jgi:septal ring factor EnvC (AmiA/AmiB activator)
MLAHCNTTATIVAMTPQKKDDEKGSDYGGPRSFVEDWLLGTLHFAAERPAERILLVLACAIGFFFYTTISDVRRQLTASQTQSAAQIAQLKSELDALKTEVRAIQVSIASQDDKLNASGQDSASLRKALDQLQDQIKALQQRLQLQPQPDAPHQQ